MRKSHMIPLIMSKTTNASPATTVKKSVYALALLPDQIPYDLGLIDRKIFNMLILVSTRSKKSLSGPSLVPSLSDSKLWYSLPITEIAHMLGLPSSKLNYAQIKTSLARLMRVVLEFSSPSAKDALNSSSGEIVRWKGRHLIEKANITEASNGLLTIYWRFDDEIEPLLVDPDRFAVLRLTSITALSDPKAIALYEICARYPDAANGSTGFKPWTWWVGALTGQMTTGPKKSKTFSEYRYFYQKAVKKAIEEVNKKTEIEIELQVKKVGRTISDMGFLVKRKPAVQQDSAVNDIPLDLVMRSSSIGISERTLTGFFRSNPIEIVEKVIEACETAYQIRKEKPGIENIGSMNKYAEGVLRAMLKKEKNNSGQINHPLMKSLNVPKVEERKKETTSSPAIAGQKIDILDSLSDKEIDRLIENAISRLRDKPNVMTAKVINDLKSRNLVKIARSEVIRQYESELKSVHTQE